MIISWSEKSTEDNSCISILDELESQSVNIRAVFLTWLNDLGSKEINNVTIIDRFTSSEGMSLWWMSLLMEKSPFKSSTIIDCLKLLALELVIVKRQPSEIELIGVTSITVRNTVAKLCSDLGVEVSFNNSVCLTESSVIGVRSIYNKIPHILRGVIALLKKASSCWKLRAARKKDYYSGKNAVFFMSYFINVDKEASQEGRFESHHWGALPEMLVSNGKSLNWLHHFIVQKDIPNTTVGLEWISTFNQNTKQNHKHAFIESYLTFSVVIRAFSRWLCAVWSSYWMPDIEKHFKPKDFAVNLWPILKDDWYNSFRGVVAAQNSLWYELFDEAMAILPKQHLGLYLYEGQSWEPAFLHAWHKHRHGKLIAVAHSTVRFWDLRYFNDPRIFKDQNMTSLILPDKVAVNGPVARKAFLDAGYPKEYLVDVEALRYLHFADSTYSSKSMLVTKVIHSKIKLLVLGDIQAINTHPLFQLLGSLPKEMQSKLIITVKPHPANYIDLSDYIELNYEVTTKPLKEILDMFDVTFGANQTSANLDAYLFGLPVIVHQYVSSLNFSPLRDTPEAQFVSTSDELANALNKLGKMKKQVENRNNYFYLDPQLPKWRELLLDNDKSENKDNLEDIY